MLRLVLAAAMVLGWASLAPRLARAARPAAFDTDGGVKRTARAVRAAARRHHLDGHVFLGKLRGVGGGRDTLIYVPRAIDPTRVIEVVVYMEGIGSFADAAMDHRHVAAIARLRGNAVYVAPDAPSSTHGQRAANTPHWLAGCAERACEGGHAAPGDFIVFLDEVRTHLAEVIGVERRELRLRHSLIGFSRGGKGVGNALAQLAAAELVVGGSVVQLADVIFADANYGETALDDAWAILSPLTDARLTILVGNGPFDDGDGNRRRALAFWRSAASGAAEPAEDRAASAPRLRVIPLPGGHHAIGDAAVDFLRAD